eukprot:g2379.t1
MSSLKSAIAKELQCSICSSLLCSPVMLEECQHLFCETCLLEWFVRKEVCPLCQAQIDPETVRKAPRIVRNLLQVYNEYNDETKSNDHSQADCEEEKSSQGKQEEEVEEVEDEVEKDGDERTSSILQSTELMRLRKRIKTLEVTNEAYHDQIRNLEKLLLGNEAFNAIEEVSYANENEQDSNETITL